MKNITKQICLAFLTPLIIQIGCDKKISVTEPDPPAFNSSLFVDSRPEGAEILLNGLNTGKVTPGLISGIEPGQYSITLKLEPFLDFDIDTVVAEDSQTYIFYNYYEDDRNFGFADLDDNISYTRMWIGGQLVNQWPEEANLYINDTLTDVILPDTLRLWPGTYKFKMTASDHRHDEKVVNIRGSRITEVRLELQDTSTSVDYNYENSDFPAMRSSEVEIDNEGVLWIGNFPGGIVKYEHGEFTNYGPNNSPMISNMINSIAVDENNTKWIATRSGLITIDNSENWNLLTSHNSPLPSDFITDVVADRNGNVWIAASDPMTRRCLVKFDGAQWEMWDAPEMRLLNSLTVDQSNNVWAGLDRGLALFNGTDWIIPDSIYSANTDFCLGINPVISLLTDLNGIVWIGVGINESVSGGLYYYDGTNFIKHESNLTQAANISLMENGDIWVSVYGYEMFAVSIHDHNPIIKIENLQSYTEYSKSQLGVTTNLFFDAVVHPNGDLWVASRDRGVIKIKMNNLND